MKFFARCGVAVPASSLNAKSEFDSIDTTLSNDRSARHLKSIHYDNMYFSTLSTGLSRCEALMLQVVFAGSRMSSDKV